MAVAANPDGGQPSRWLALRHAEAYVAGFGLVFTLLGITATFAAGPLVDYLPCCARSAGSSSSCSASNLAGVLPIPSLERAWRPLDAGASTALATMSGTTALAPRRRRRRRSGQPVAGGPPRRPHRLDARRLALVVRARRDLRGRLDAVHRRDPRRNPDDGCDDRHGRPGRDPALGYTLGLGLPFLVLGALYDRAPAITRPLVRHGRLVSAIGGALVVAIGVAMLMDWLALLPRYFNFNTAI